MGLQMPNPTLLNGNYYIRLSVPADVAKLARGTRVTIPVGDTYASSLVTSHVKASLRTKDPAVARQRFPAALAAVEQHWNNLRKGPTTLTHKQMLALAGDMRATFITILDENPGSGEMWDGVPRADRMAQEGVWHELMVPIRPSK
jgi:hypothetical protein